MKVDLETVRAALEKTVPGSSKDVTDETKVEDLPIDSLDTYQLYAELEDQTGKSVSDDDFETLVSIADVIAFFNA